MAKVLINISDETYEYVKQNYRYGIGAEVACNLGFAVAKGTPVPKGHGRLIDADELIKDYGNPDIEILLKNMDTIIEADKDSKKLFK